MLLFCAVASAQAPITFTNSPEAVRRHEEDLLDGLRARCETVKSVNLFLRAEMSAVRNGYLSVQALPKEPWRYEAFAYDQDKRSFVLVDGQRLGKGVRLTLKLALPRDYARCRIVHDGTGGEFLELVHRDSNAPGEGQAMDRLLRHARDVAAEQALSAANHGACAAPSRRDRVVSLAAELDLPSCVDASDAVLERMNRVVRRLFDR